MVKSYGLYSEIITEAEAKITVGHKALKVFFEIFKERKFNELLEKYPELKEVSSINRFKSNLDEYKSTLFDENETWDISFSRETLQNIITNIDTLGDELEEVKRRINPKESLRRKTVNYILNFIFCLFSLSVLSLVFTPHAVRSRYPQDNFNPLEVYDDKMPLVQTLDHFMKIAEETLEKLNQIYTELSGG